MAAPSGGFCPAGSSGGNGVSVFMFQRILIAVWGLNITTSWTAVSTFTWRSGVMLSRIQKLLPCVPTTISSSLITRSRMEVAGMFNLSVCQCSPASNETYTAFSEPANNNPFFTASSRTVLMGSFGSPTTIFFHVAPPSLVL